MLLDLIPGSIHCGAFRLLNGHCHLEVGHLGRQQTNLGSISCPLFHKPLLGRVNTYNGIDQALVEPHLRLLRGLQFLSQVLHFRLCFDQTIMIRSAL